MFKQALKIRQQLAEDNPKAYNPELATTLDIIGSLNYISMNQKEKGVLFCKRALKIYRQIAIDNPTQDNIQNVLRYQRKIVIMEFLSK